MTFCGQVLFAWLKTIIINELIMKAKNTSDGKSGRRTKLKFLLIIYTSQLYLVDICVYLYNWGHWKGQILHKKQVKKKAKKKCVNIIEMWLSEKA